MTKLLLDGNALKKAIKARAKKAKDFSAIPKLKEAFENFIDGLNWTLWECESGRFTVTGGDYTPMEALAKAKKRWPNLKPFVVFNSNKPGHMNRCYEIGRYSDLKVWYGPSFRDCFAKADKEKP